MGVRYFEDLCVGEVRYSDFLQVEQEDILAWARRYDPQYFHADPEAAKESIFGGLVAPGIFTAAIWRQLDHRINSDVRYLCGTGWDDVRWPAPMRPGDRVQARSEILSLALHPKRPERGQALYDYRLLRDDGQLLMSMRSHNLIERRALDAPSDPSGNAP